MDEIQDVEQRRSLWMATVKTITETCFQREGQVSDLCPQRTPTDQDAKTLALKSIARLTTSEAASYLRHSTTWLLKQCDIPYINGVSHRTLNLELTFLRTFFKHAIQNHHAQHNPAREVTNLPETDGEEVWIPNKTEFIRFVEVAKTLPTAMVFVPLIWFRAHPHQAQARQPLKDGQGALRRDPRGAEA